MKYLRLNNLLCEVKWTVCFVFFTCIYKDATCHHHNGELNSSSAILMNLLEFAEGAVHTAEHYVHSNMRYENHLPMDCADILKKNILAKSGIYEVYPRNRIVQGPINVYCDMDDDGGAWTVLQRRGDFQSAQDYFYRDWINYKNGFGDPMQDFWIGNDIIYALTNQRSNSLKFDLADWEGNFTYAVYDNFWMDDEEHYYSIHVGAYKGNAGDGFTFTNRAPFSTKDRDNDWYDKGNCAEMFKGAWWYTACHLSNLNGLYLKGPHESFADGVNWEPFRGYFYSLKDTVLKIRPKDFVRNVDSDVTLH